MDESYRLKIEYVPLDRLKPYERNARKHGDKDIDAIAASIKRFGFKDPIGVWGKNVIVEGHGRLLAAKKLNLAEVPIIRLDDLTDEERRMYALAHNKTAELSNWDFDTLDSELDELGKMFDMDEFGFIIESEENKIQKEKGDVPFTEELMLTHNYIVLYFDNDFDWMVAQEKFKLKEVRDLIPRKSQPTGIGRVISGKEVLEWLN